jgi:hypothetical protein
MSATRLRTTSPLLTAALLTAIVFLSAPPVMAQSLRIGPATISANAVKMTPATVQAPALSGKQGLDSPLAPF